MIAAQTGSPTISEEEQVRILFGRDPSDRLVRTSYDPPLFAEVKKISEGMYANIYSAKNSRKEEVILKINKIRSYRLDLLEEGHILARITAQGGYDFGIVKHLGVWASKKKTILVQEHLGPSLKSVLEKGPLPIENIRKYTLPLFQALYFLQNVAYNEASILHRDVKHNNLVYDPSRKIFKLIDFNSATVLRNGEKCDYFEVSAPAYRAPEVFKKEKYNASIDMWGLGVVLVEMFTGKLLITEEKETLNRITELFGALPKEQGPPRKKRKTENPPQLGIHQVLSKADDLFKDLILKMLHLNPEERLKPVEALEHPFLEVQ